MKYAFFIVLMAGWVWLSPAAQAQDTTSSGGITIRAVPDSASSPATQPDAAVRPGNRSSSSRADAKRSPAPADTSSSASASPPPSPSAPPSAASNPAESDPAESDLATSNARVSDAASDSRMARLPADSTTDASPTRTSRRPLTLPDGSWDTIQTLNVEGANVTEVYRAIADRYDLSLVVDPRVQGTVSARLSGIRVIDALRFLTEQHGHELKQTGAIFHIVPIETEPEPLAVEVSDGRISIDVTDAPIRDVARRISEVSPTNVMVASGTSGSVSGYMNDASFERGLQSFVENNGFVLRRDEDILVIEQPASTSGSPQGRSSSQQVTVEDGRISLNVNNAPIRQVVQSVAREMDIEIVTYAQPQGSITARVSGLTLDETFDYLLRSADVSFLRQGDVYVLGKRNESGVTGSRLIRLEHIKGEDLQAMLPPPMARRVSVKAVKEQNGIVVTGPRDAVQAIESFTREVDRPTPQIMIEALVVDFEESGLFELGLEFGKVEAGQEPPVNGDRYRFDDGGLSGSADGPSLSRSVNSALDVASEYWDGIGNVGRLPSEFFASVRALAQEGKAEILSRPQISTLNGHQASISIGTTQYYILRGDRQQQGGAGAGSGVFPVQTERFERIEANVILEITPRVTASGEVTVKIRPEFSTPVGRLDPSVPPTINTRVIESTVRLQDGETIVLGGLIQESKVVSENKVPILGHIPLLGRLFRSRSHDTRKSELVIYLTPHVFYGEGDERKKWESMLDTYGHEDADDEIKGPGD